MLFFPFTVKAKGHVSLNRNRIQLDVRAFGIAFVKLRILRENSGFATYINGAKQKKPKKDGMKRALSALKQYKFEHIKMAGNVNALIGAQDARDSAMICAAVNGILAPISSHLRVYASGAGENFELDGNVRLKINLYQIAALLFEALKPVSKSA